MSHVILRSFGSGFSGKFSIRKYSTWLLPVLPKNFMRGKRACRDRRVPRIQGARSEHSIKENTPDTRNSQVFNVIRELRSYGLEVMVCDPVANAAEVADGHGIDLLDWEQLPRADAVVLAVAHQVFIDRLGELKNQLRDPAVVIDVKSVVGPGDLPEGAAVVWRL